MRLPLLARNLLEMKRKQHLLGRRWVLLCISPFPIIQKSGRLHRHIGGSLDQGIGGFLPSHFHPPAPLSLRPSPPGGNYLVEEEGNIRYMSQHTSPVRVLTWDVTLVLQLGQLFAQRVVALLQQPLLLLHALHVLSQRADLRLVLYE